MLIPSIDLQGGRTVQLVGGEELALEAGDPLAIAERFAPAGEIAVVDLDGALGEGDNSALVRALCERYPCRVGGGIRDVETAIRWLDAGARSIVIGTAATPELLRQLPAERVVVALDARDGEVVDEGWRRRTGRRVEERMAELQGLAGGFLVTFVEREGRLGGTALERVAPLVEAAGGARLTIAGGVTTCDEIAALDALGADAQVGMALYTGQLDLGDAFLAPLRLEPEALVPTVVVDESGRTLGQVWSDRESVRAAFAQGRGVYHSRRRGLWVKGETSGAHQDLLRMQLDCDRDSLRVTVRQHGGSFCHTGTRSCWGDDGGLPALVRRLGAQRDAVPAGSYTARLLKDPRLLAAKLVEEAGELADARTADEVAAEAADVLYFTAVALSRAGVSLEQVDQVLDRRALRVTRRPGNAKTATTTIDVATTPRATDRNPS